MDSTTTVWIVVVIVAVLVIAALGFAARSRRNQHRHVEAERIREDVTTHIAKVDKREALADETAAKARAAEAEAEAKAAEAARLKEPGRQPSRGGLHVARGTRRAPQARRQDRSEDACRAGGRRQRGREYDQAAEQEAGRHEAERK